MDSFEQRFASAQEIRESIASGSIATADRSTLTKYVTWLSGPNANGAMPDNEHMQAAEIVRLHMLRTMMDDIESRNALTQRLVIALTVAALIVGIPQLWFAYKADKRAEIAQTTNTASAAENKPLMSAPTPATPPSTHPAESKAAGGKEAKKGKP